MKPFKVVLTEGMNISSITYRGEGRPSDVERINLIVEAWDWLPKGKRQA